MTTYAIGDIQGCFFTLQHLLSEINFSPSRDKLWLCGDLVNRGQHSLKTCLYLMSLGNSVVSVLGNHDLALLGMAYATLPIKTSHTLQDILESSHKAKVLEWLKQMPLFYLEKNKVLVHAGLYPLWSPEEAEGLSNEVSSILQSAEYTNFFKDFFGNLPKRWDNKLSGIDRLRFIVNACTRMRYCYPNADLNLDIKGPPAIQADGAMPWYEIPNPRREGYRIFFGHWASLQGHTSKPEIRALDTGCSWGRWLTCENIDTAERIQVPALAIDLPQESKK